MPFSSGSFRLLTTSITANLSAPAAGRYTLATLATSIGGGLTSDTVRGLIVSLGATKEGKRQRGVELELFGSGADNSTITYYIYQLKWGRSSIGASQPSDFEVQLHGSIAATLSAATGPAGDGGAVLSTERIADTLAWTINSAASGTPGVGDCNERVYGAQASEAYSPANNTPGRMFLTDLGDGDLLIVPVFGTATGANAMVEVLT